MELRLSEELLLLALDDEKGKIIPDVSVYILFGLAGAVLLESAEKQKIKPDEKKLEIIDSRPTGDFVYDFVIQFISKSTKPRTIAYCGLPVGCVKKLKQAENVFTFLFVVRMCQKPRTLS